MGKVEMVRKGHLIAKIVSLGELEISPKMKKLVMAKIMRKIGLSSISGAHSVSQVCNTEIDCSRGLEWGI